MRKLVLLFILSSFGLFAQKIPEKNQSFKESIERGVVIYEDFCSTCHQYDGKGLPGENPPLANSDYLVNNREDSIKTIKFGKKGEIIVNGITYNGMMETLGLTHEEIADVMNYITNTWGNLNDKLITVEEVSKIKK